MPGLGGVEPSDGVLAQRAADGDEKAFEILLDRHYDACLRFATRMLASHADAQDAVQETFIRAYRALPRYESRDRFRGWLFRILINRCRTAGARVQRLRGRQRAYREVTEGAVEPVAASNGLLEPITRALQLLPAEHREAFLLKHVEELSYEEMAKLTGAGVSALKMRVKRARERLQDLLGDLHD